jgi:hypothetical protein
LPFVSPRVIASTRLRGSFESAICETWERAIQGGRKLGRQVRMAKMPDVVP